MKNSGGLSVYIWSMLMNFCGLRKVYRNFEKEDFLGSGLFYSVCNLSFGCRMWDLQFRFGIRRLNSRPLWIGGN